MFRPTIKSQLGTRFLRHRNACKGNSTFDLFDHSNFLGGPAFQVWCQNGDGAAVGSDYLQATKPNHGGDDDKSRHY